MTPEIGTLWVSIGGVVVAILTLIIVIRQLGLMERQDEIIARSAELIRKAECDVSAREVIFDAENTGKRGVDSFDWHIWVPDVLGKNWTMIDIYAGDISSHSSDEQINGKNYSRFSGCFRDHLYPTRHKAFARLKLTNSTDGTYTFYTQIACEDGVFPEKIEDNPLPITIHFP